MTKGTHRKDSPEETEKVVKRGKVHRYNQNKKWTRAEEDQVTRLRKQGKTWSEIGHILHRSKIAVYVHDKVVRARNGSRPQQDQEKSDE